MITAKSVKELREMTGAGMMDCKKALVQTEGDIEKAVEYLREKGLAAAAKKAGFENVIMTDSLEEAVKVSSKQAVSGDAVLLSPACASWGMFKNFEERGKLFKEYVNSLE